MARARYDAVADFYVSGFDSVADPATRVLLDLLGPVAGLRVLDVACGHGRITRELARRGAQVIGIDISGNLIAKAKEIEHNERLGIRYRHADIAAPGVLGDGGFDAAVCNFGLSDIDELDAAITTIGAYLGTLRRHGLWLDQLAEPPPEPDWDPAHDADRKPVFLAARFVNLPPG